MSERLGIGFLAFSPMLEHYCMSDWVARCLNTRADEQLCDCSLESYRAVSGALHVVLEKRKVSSAKMGSQKALPHSGELTPLRWAPQ